MKKISIIIPCYNAEDTIKKCLDSIICQTIKPYEVIIIDDGSTDNTTKICKEYITNEYNNFKYYRKQNGGVSSARNMGIDRAKGDYLAFIDADDTIDEKYIETLSMIVNNSNSDIIVFSFVKNRFNCRKKAPRYLEKNDALGRIICDPRITSGCLNKIYKKQIVNKVRFIDSPIAEDLAFNMDIIEKEPDLSIMLVGNMLYKYNTKSNNSIMHGGFSNQYLKILSTYKMLIDKEGYPINSLLRAALVPVSIKCYIKMKNSNIDDKKVELMCRDNIKKFSGYLMQNRYVSLHKRVAMVILGKLIVRQKQVLPKRIINYIDKNFG